MSINHYKSRKANKKKKIIEEQIIMNWANSPTHAVATDAKEVPIVNTTLCLSNMS